MERRALSENEIPTLPAFPVPVVRALVIDTSAEAFFAVGRAMNDHASSNDPQTTDALSEGDLAAIGFTPAQRRRDLSRFVLAIVVVCLAILGAGLAHVG